MFQETCNNFKPIIIIGAGGHACTIVDYLIKKRKKIIGFTDKIKSDFVYNNICVIGQDNKILDYTKEDIDLVMGIGIIPHTSKRIDKIKWFEKKGYKFVNVVSPYSFVSSSVYLGTGVHIASGTTIQANVKIGNNSIINTNSSVDHNSLIGSNSHIAPGVTVCGNVVINDNVFVGAGSTIINGVKIGQSTFIPAGSIITKDLPSNTNLKFLKTL